MIATPVDHPTRAFGSTTKASHSKNHDRHQCLLRWYARRKELDDDEDLIEGEKSYLRNLYYIHGQASMPKRKAIVIENPMSALG